MHDDDGFIDYLMFEKTSGSGGGGNNSGGGCGGGCLTWILVGLAIFYIISCIVK